MVEVPAVAVNVAVVNARRVLAVVAIRNFLVM